MTDVKVHGTKKSATLRSVENNTGESADTKPMHMVSIGSSMVSYAKQVEKRELLARIERKEKEDA